MSKKIERPKDKYKHFVISKIEYECDKRDIDNKHQQIIARASESTYNRKRRDPESSHLTNSRGLRTG